MQFEQIIWNEINLNQALKERLTKPIETKIKAYKVVFDSRQITGGEIFIALNLKTKTDSNDYVKNALNNGASAVISQKKILEDNRIILVDDSFKALNDLAIFNRNQSKAKFIAITGSLGKTSTKEALFYAFCQSVKVQVGQENYNNYIGVPLNLCAISPNSSLVGLEVGMNNKNEIRPLSKMIMPEIAIITNISYVHTENFDDGIKGIALSKSEIFEGLVGDKIAIIPKKSLESEIIHSKAKIYAKKIFEFGEDTSVKLTNYFYENQYLNAEYNIFNEKILLRLNMFNPSQASNLCAILLLGKILGFSLKNMKEGLELMNPIKGRGLIIKARYKNKNFHILDESYNASFESTKSSIKHFNNLSLGKRKVIILADMLEIGDKSCEFHEALASFIPEDSLFIAIGQLMFLAFEKAKSNKIYFKNIEEFLEEIDNILIDEDFLLIKGSNSKRLFLIIDKLRENDL